MSKKKQIVDPVEQEEKYVEFLKTRLNSENYKTNTTSEEYKNTKKKYDKAKLKLKFLKESKK